MRTDTPPIRIVVVEDDRNVAAVLEARLTSFGYQVCSSVRDGAAAVRTVLEHRPDLVLMDILLEGGMNGIEAAEKIKQRIDVPIVFLTCLNDQHMLDRAIKTHAYGYILKPYATTELKFTIQTALIKHQAAKEKEALVASLKKALAARKRAEELLLEYSETLEQKVHERTCVAESRSKQLQRLAVQLIEAEEQERRRLAELLHDDLQQTLAAAKMQLESVAEDTPSEPLASIVRLLKESIAKSRRLSHELSPAILHQTDLTGTLEWLADQMKAQFGLKVELVVSAELPKVCAPQKVFLFRAVQELLFNTVKHAGVRSARIEAKSSENSIAVAVSDPGRGFDAEILQQRKAGFGLLKIKERASYIGGAFQIESAPGQGSRFTLTVPNASAVENRGPDPDEPVPTEGDGPPKTATAVAAGLRVIFADDHRMVRQGLIRMVKDQPAIHVVGEASNGREALEMAQRLKPDLVVMDISMPEMNGIEATRLIKKKWPTVRIIGLSMHGDEKTIASIMKAGAEAYLPKTASPAQLVKAIYGNRQVTVLG